MLFACRLAGYPLEAHYAGVNGRPQIRRVEATDPRVGERRKIARTSVFLPQARRKFYSWSIRASVWIDD